MKVVFLLNRYLIVVDFVLAYLGSNSLFLLYEING